MKRLKIILQSNYFFFLFLFITLFLVVISFLKPTKSIFNENTKEITGKIVSYKIDGNLLSFTLTSKEKIQAFYYFETEEEKIKYEHDLGIGDILFVKGALSFPEENSLPNTFNYKTYLKFQNIHYIMNAEEITILEKASGLDSLKNWITKKIKRLPYSNYLLTMVLGNTSDFDLELVRGNGISHLFAISGMHISLFVTFLNAIIKKGGKLKDAGIACFLVFYSFLVGFTPSVLRATISTILGLVNKNYELQFSRFKIFFLTLAIVLIINPFFLMNIGFQYSFLISFGLLFMKKSKNYFIGLFKISIYSFIISLPITAINFYEVNLLSILWNLFFVPYVSFLLYPFCFIYLIFPFTEFLFSGLVSIFETINEWCYTMNFFKIVIPKLSISYWFIYYIICFLFLTKTKKAYFIFLIIMIAFGKYLPKFDSSSYVYFLDVGQGDSTLFISSYQKEAILIDTGGKISYNTELWQQRRTKVDDAKTIKTFLNSLGIAKINLLVLTHGDYDHMGEAINLVNNFNVEKVILNCGEVNKLEQDLIDVLDKKKIEYYSCIKELNINDNKLYFLNNKDYGNENDNSSVIYTELNNHKFLLMGDAGVEAEEDLINKYNLQDIDILKVGHHGSKTSSSEKFIDEIVPKYSIISVGKSNRYGHPNNSVLENLEDSKIFRTDKHGSIMFKIKNNKLDIETCAP